MKKHESGQTLLVVVLVMIVALTVGLSVLSRTITSLRISKQNEESQRAFQAAEAGIERVLQSSSQGKSEFGDQNNASYDAKPFFTGGSTLLLNGGDQVEQDIGIDLWTSQYPDYALPTTGRISIYWTTSDQDCSASGNNTRAALEVLILSGDPANPTIDKKVYDTNLPAGCSSRIPGASTSITYGSPYFNIEDTDFRYKADIDLVNALVMKIVPIYNSTKIAVSLDGNCNSPSPCEFPDQGKKIESVGISGETQRKVVYFSSHPQIPLEIFPYSIISQ